MFAVKMKKMLLTSVSAETRSIRKTLINLPLRSMLINGGVTLKKRRATVSKRNIV